MAQSIRPVMLLILDGFGWREASADNAVRLARKPNFDRLWQSCPHAFLRTSGLNVGLPDGQMMKSACRIAPIPLPDWSEVKTPGAVAASGTVTLFEFVPFCTTIVAVCPVVP